MTESEVPPPADAAVKRCENCGRANAMTATLCVHCHFFLPWSGAESHTPATTPDPEPDPAPNLAPDPEPASAPARDVEEAIEAGRRAAAVVQRPDLEAQLDRTRAQLNSKPIRVSVVGQSKTGKSALINALLQTAVCPVDPDIATAVPTTICYAESPRVTTYSIADNGSHTDEEEAPLDSLPRLVCENEQEPERRRLVEVGLPHPLLESGLQLVDTPGVGGLDSAYGVMTLDALRNCDAVLVVTDAARELTATEIDFLQVAAQRCARLAVVLTKVDLYAHWERIAQLNQQHLAAVGLIPPVFPVSSFLRLKAVNDPDLDFESGFESLMVFLATKIVLEVGDVAARQAAADVDFVVAQLQQQTDAERAIIEDPACAEDVLAELHVVKEQAERLSSPTTTWQQSLSDGVQDLSADIEHDLQHRLRQVVKEAEEAIEGADPRRTWDEMEAWLSRAVAVAIVGNRDLLYQRAHRLAWIVAEQFELPAGTGFLLSLASSETDSGEVTLAPASSLSMPGGRFGPLLAAARSGVYLPVVLGSAAANALSMEGSNHVMMLGASAILGAGFGRKIIKDERQRQRQYRQQQAKAAIRKYVDDVAFRANKQTRDWLRSAQRQLRDDFLGRALSLELSAGLAIEAAQGAAALESSGYEARRDELAAQDDRVAHVRRTVGELVGQGV